VIGVLVTNVTNVPLVSIVASFTTVNLVT
jgi:hypothetical protein